VAAVANTTLLVALCVEMEEWMDQNSATTPTSTLRLVPLADSLPVLSVVQIADSTLLLVRLVEIQLLNRREENNAKDLI